ncbi:DHA1 family inner membrane transport protein [Ereboglobus sp. PH5-10]|nr:DHA1 family inner membrane transport protein [Ereboglobus sp. PH5-10]
MVRGLFMSFTPATLPNGKPINERLTLFVLAAVQFTHILDFMIMQPLGSRLMAVFSITPGQFTRLVAVYGLAAAVSGFLAGFVLDRVNRKHALLTLYGGFALSTLCCALAPTYWALLAARCAAGAFGGVASSVVVAMVGDIIPPEQRGRAMAIVGAAFPLASIMGIPLGLKLTGAFEWHAPFFMLVGMSAIVFGVGVKTLPSIQAFAPASNPWGQMRDIVTHPVHRRCFVLTIALVFGGASVIPLMAPAMVANAGIPEDDLFLIYLCGGAVTFMTTPLIGRWTDRCDKVRLIGVFSAIAICAVVLLTNLPRVSLVPALMAATFFTTTMSSRFGPTMAMIANAVEARYRGGFMSVNAAVQQAGGGLATMCAGLLVSSDPETGRLVGYSYVGIMSVFFMGVTYLLARRLASAAPWAARPGQHKGPVVMGAGTLLNRLASAADARSAANNQNADDAGGRP